MRGYVVNLGEYAALEWANDTKLRAFAIKHKANTYNEQLSHSDDCLDLELTPLKFMTSHKLE